MKTFIKTILITALGLAVLAPEFSFSQNAGPQPFRFLPLLSGYNVLVATNKTYGPASLAVAGVTNLTCTNVLSTTYNGQVVYSYSNNANGGLSTNGFAGDAFKVVKMGADANGDLPANASVIITIDNTNLLPIVATNAQGQFFIPVVTTNGAFPFQAGPNPTIWPLGVASGPSWMYPATTNFYPTFVAATNPVVVTLYRSPCWTFKGTGESTLDPNLFMWETTSTFSFTVTPNNLLPGSYPLTIITNLPVAWQQGAYYVTATVTATAMAATSQGVLINQLGILQPQP